MIRILIAEDEAPIANLVKLSLKKAGYLCECVSDGEEAAEKIGTKAYDLILLDVMLPEIDGFELMEYIRPLGIPVIFLTAKNAVSDRVKGLRMGAEDYIVKPFEIVELLARVDVVLRRYRLSEEEIHICGLDIDTRSMRVTREGQEIALTRKEYELLLDLHVQKLLSETGDIRNVIGQSIRQNGGYWDDILLTADGKEIYSGGEETALLGKQDFAEQGKYPEEGTGIVVSVRNDSGENNLCAAGTFTAGDRQFSLTAARDISDLYRNRNRMQEVYRIVFAVLMLLCAVLAYSMALFLTAPLSRLARGAREIGKGNFAFRSRVRSGDEVGSLSRDFDRMAGQIEKNVRELREAVARQERFVGNFTHELKTPMTSVIGYADLLRSSELSDKERREAADYIFREGKRLERLSLKLLDIYAAEQTEGSLSPHSPGRIVEDIADHLRPGLQERGIVLTARCEKGTCMLDPDLFRSLVLNLVDNAGKALGSRGHIRVTVRMTDAGCRLCVEDDGPGIPGDAREHLTEAFYRVDKSRSRKQGGAGLGLSLCEKIVKLHGGELSFESEEGRGTKVTAELKGGRCEKKN